MSPDEQGVWPCEVLGAPPHWPAMQVLAISLPGQPGQRDEALRLAARQRVREVLRAHGGTARLAHLRTSFRAEPPPGPVAVSHATGLSLLAWCEQGCLGIDLVDIAALRAAPTADLMATAALYLGPQGLDEASSWLPQGADTVERFAAAWAGHEARLKCLGLGLAEWSATAPAPTIRCAVVPIRLPPEVRGTGASEWSAWLAWRASSEPR